VNHSAGAATPIGRHEERPEARRRASADGVAATATYPSCFLGRIAGLATQSRLPAIYHAKTSVDAGRLMSYGPSPLDINRRVAVYVDKILKGAKPADLPVEQPTTFELVINLKAAEAIGLTIPPSVLFQADEVIK
jgi:ABC-type uncharacterized transport system substrate-binding protein